MTAADRILGKAIITSGLDSRQWSTVHAGLRDRAFFISTCESARFDYSTRKMVAEASKGGISASDFRLEARKVLADENYQPSDPRLAGTIKDLRTKRRLDLIRETNVAQARGYVRHLEATTPGAFAAFPAQELFRMMRREKPRDWTAKWTAAGGRLYGGRMIALKGDPVWTRISRFGNPYPPFDFNSGMRVRSVDADETMRLGIADEKALRAKLEEIRKAPPLGFNGNMRAELPFSDDSPEAARLREAFGDQVDFRGNVAHWRGELIGDVLGGKVKSISLGVGFNGEKTSFSHRLFADHVIKHFGENETHGNSVPLERGDFELLPTLWRKPDRVTTMKNGHALLELDLFDGSVLTMAYRRGYGPLTLYKQKPPGA